MLRKNILLIFNRNVKYFAHFLVRKKNVTKNILHILPILLLVMLYIYFILKFGAAFEVG